MNDWGSSSAHDRPLGWSEIAAAVLRRRWIVVGVVVSAMLSAIVMVMLEPPKYRATARVLVNSDVADIPVSPEENTAAIVAFATEQRITDVSTMLESPALVREVLAAMPAGDEKAADEDDGPSFADRMLAPVRFVVHLPTRIYNSMHDVPQGDETEIEVLDVLGGLDADRIDESDLIEVSYVGRHPKWAADFINTLVGQYTSYEARAEQKPEAVRFFREQRALLSARRDQAEAALAAFRARTGTGLSPDDQQALREARGRLDAARSDMNMEVAGLDARIATLQAQRGELAAPESLGSAVELSSTVASLKAAVMDLELERSKLLSSYAPSSDVVADLDRRLARAKSMLAEEKRSLSKSMAASSPMMQDLEVELVRARARRAELVASLAAMETEIQGIGQKLQRCDALALEKRRLENELAAAEESYSTYQKKEEQARFVSAMHDSAITNVTVVESALVPTMPQESRKLLTLAAVFVLSLVVGCGLAVLRDRMDPTISSVDEVGTLTGLPVIGEISFEDNELARYYEEDLVENDLGPGDGSTPTRRGRLPIVLSFFVALAIGSGLGAFQEIRSRDLASSKMPRLESAEVLSVTARAVAPVRPLHVVEDTTLVGERIGDGQPVAAPAVSPEQAEATPTEAVVAEPAQEPYVETAAPAPDDEPAATAAVIEAMIETPAPAAAAAPAPARVTSIVEITDKLVVKSADYAASQAVVDAPEPAVTVITVERGTTLYSLMRKVYGAYNAELLAMFREANPQFSDPTELRIGDVLRFPPVPERLSMLVGRDGTR